ncbi:MAG: DUF2892 domain-containing protein [Bacteroidales bacterium]|jgi:hypothetical protein
MKKNVGSIDKIIRYLIAAIIIILFFTNVISGTFGIIGLIVAGILIVTSLVSFCGLYSVLGISTCKTKA